MTIQVMLKNPSNLHKPVKPCPMELSAAPHTLRELITACVDACITAYRNRAKESQNPSPLSDEEFAGMEALGKFAFGVHYGGLVHPRRYRSPHAGVGLLLGSQDRERATDIRHSSRDLLGGHA